MIGFAGRKITVRCEFCTALCANIKQENFLFIARYAALFLNGRWQSETSYPEEMKMRADNADKDTGRM